MVVRDDLGHYCSAGLRKKSRVSGRLGGPDRLITDYNARESIILDASISRLTIVAGTVELSIREQKLLQRVQRTRNNI